MTAFSRLARRVGFLLLTATLSQAAVAQESSRPDGAGIALALPAITVSEVRPLFLRDRVIASGLVGAVEEVHVQPLVSGEAVEDLLADIGDTVIAGDVLARLESTTLDLQRSELAANRATVMASIAQAEANLIEARANADEAQRVADRAAALRAQGNIAEAQAEQAASALESALARVRVAELGIESAEAQLAVIDAQVATLDLRVGRTEVRSPASGLVVARNAIVGEIASGGGQPLFVIVRDGVMELRAEVSEVDLARLAPGMHVSMMAVGAIESLDGSIRMIEPTIDTNSRLGIARVAFNSDDLPDVRQGMFLTAEITVREGEVLAIPITAVGAGPEGTTVMRVVNGVVERVSVVTGMRDSGLVEVLSGLEPGDLVVTKAASFVRDGDRIRPMGEDGTEVQVEG
jgi:HlyD family secretion protein